MPNKKPFGFHFQMVYTCFESTHGIKNIFIVCVLCTFSVKAKARD